MTQCEPCIQIKKKRIKSQKERKNEQTERVGARKREREKGKMSFSLISEIYRNQTVGFRRSKRQSRSTHRELCVDTEILEFRQTPRGREFFYLKHF